MDEMRRFNSKRNTVGLIRYNGEKVIRKQFKHEKDCESEKRNYKQVKGEILVPEILESFSDTLLIEYLPFDNYCDLLMEQERTGFESRPWKKLWDWLEECDRKCGILPDDGNLRNFLWDPENGLTYGIDLEAYREYALMECYADFLVHLEIYRPYHTKVKKKIADMIRNRMLLEAQKEKGDMFVETDLQEYVKRARERTRRRQEASQKCVE